MVEIFAKHVWPGLRFFVRLSKRCRRCILSEKYSPLINGLCRECSQHTLAKLQEPDEVAADTGQRFDQTIKSYINDNKYHALLLLSGGKDSAYIVQRLKLEFPELRILCALVNNGFMSPIAVDSARYVTEKLQTDLLII